MYKGNMQELVDRLNQYCQKQFEVDLALHKDEGGQFYLNTVKNGMITYRSATVDVFDTEDFEEQCYMHVRKILKSR